MTKNHRENYKMQYKNAHVYVNIYDDNLKKKKKLPSPHPA